MDIDSPGKNDKDKEKIWEERRKKNLILRGLFNPSSSTVMNFLESYKLTSREKVSSVNVRKVAGKDWAFISFPTEEEVERCYRNRLNLKGTSFYLQKDLSKEVREKMKEERAKKLISQQFLPAPLPALPAYPNGALMAGPHNGFQQHPNVNLLPPLYPNWSPGLQQLPNYPPYSYPSGLDPGFNPGAFAPPGNYRWVS